MNRYKCHRVLSSGMAAVTKLLWVTLLACETGVAPVSAVSEPIIGWDSARAGHMATWNKALFVH